MNIGVFTDTYFPQISGVATSVFMLKKELTDLGHKVYIFTTSDPEANNFDQDVYRLPSMPFVFLPSRRLALYYPPKLLIKIKMLKLDIIHTQTEFPLGILGKIVSEFTRTPLIHTYHTMYEDYVHYVARGNLITPKMAQQYSRIFCNRADVVIAPVEKAKESLLDYGVVKPIEIVPTGIDFEPFSRLRFTKDEILKAKREIGLNETDPVIVSVGRIAKEKSIDVIINQFSKLLQRIPEAKLVFIGDGPALPDLTELAKGIGISNSVIFAGARQWDIIGKYYQIGDAFITASTSETQGLTYVEAMASGVPVIAKKDKSNEGVLMDGKTGYTFENDDDASEVMYKALKESRERLIIAENALNSVQHFSSKRFARSLESIYFQTIENNKTLKRGKSDLISLINSKKTTARNSKYNSQLKIMNYDKEDI